MGNRESGDEKWKTLLVFIRLNEKKMTIYSFKGTSNLVFHFNTNLHFCNLRKSVNFHLTLVIYRLQYVRKEKDSALQFYSPFFVHTSGK